MRKLETKKETFQEEGIAAKYLKVLVAFEYEISQPIPLLLQGSNKRDSKCSGILVEYSCTLLRNIVNHCN